MFDSQPTEPEAAYRSRHRRLGWIIFLVVAAFLATLGTFIYRSGRPHHMGTFTSTGPTLGEWTMDVDVCHTGSRRNFSGAQFYSSKDQRLGIWMIEDPLRGLVPSVNSTTTHDAINIAPANCTVLTGHAHDTSSTLHPPALIAGEYTVECQVEESQLTGHVEFQDCL